VTKRIPVPRPPRPSLPVIAAAIFGLVLGGIGIGLLSNPLGGSGSSEIGDYQLPPDAAPIVCDQKLGPDPNVETIPPQPACFWRGGALEGGDALFINAGDIIGARNFQCGTTASRGSCDISASAKGTLSLNFDQGRCTRIFDGQKRILARFCPRSIVFYVKPRVRRR